MDTVNFHRIEAVHPHWRGFLRLSSLDGSVVHEAHGSGGTYELNNHKLTVFWEKFSPDVFYDCSGTFVHQDLAGDIPNIERMSFVTVNKKIFRAKRITVAVTSSNYEVTLRLNTSDIPTFHQVFGAHEYDSNNLPASANVIVDLGANIGLAAVFFAIKYPDARILCVEPEAENFAMLLSNTATLGSRVETQHSAVWVNDGFINLHTEDEFGATLGMWGVRTLDRVSKSGKATRCYKLDTLLDNSGFAAVDILKIDIEGAEQKIFSEGVEKWLPRINMIIVETHDRFQPGSESAVREAIQPMFEELPSVGENLIFRRGKSSR